MTDFFPVLKNQGHIILKVLLSTEEAKQLANCDHQDSPLFTV